MTLPPYSSRREEELRRRLEEGEARRRRIEEEFTRQNQENQPDAAANGPTLEERMEQLRRKYFLMGIGVGAVVGTVGGAAFGYALDNYQWTQSLPLKEAFDYKNTFMATPLCLILGASLGALLGDVYGRRAARQMEKEQLEKGGNY